MAKKSPLCLILLYLLEVWCDDYKEIPRSECLRHDRHQITHRIWAPILSIAVRVLFRCVGCLFWRCDPGFNFFTHLLLRLVLMSLDFLFDPLRFINGKSGLYLSMIQRVSRWIWWVKFCVGCYYERIIKFVIFRKFLNGSVCQLLNRVFQLLISL